MITGQGGVRFWLLTNVPHYALIMHYIDGGDLELLADKLFRRNRRLAREKWGLAINRNVLDMLKGFSRDFGFSVSSGDLLLLDRGWYVTHAGLIRLARRNRCHGILVKPTREFCDPKESRWAFEATVYRSRACRGFVGYGDADPSNVSYLVHGAEMRVAETRAVNRALRKAYGIGLCSAEELGWSPKSPSAERSTQNASSVTGNNGHSNGQPRLRDRLCLLIRQHQLDASLVKAYAADYCGTSTLRDASRESVEAFINNLAEQANKDRDGLLCRLNSYSRREEVTR